MCVLWVCITVPDGHYPKPCYLRFIPLWRLFLIFFCPGQIYPHCNIKPQLLALTPTRCHQLFGTFSRAIDNVSTCWTFIRLLDFWVCLDDLPVKGIRQTPTRGYKHQAGNSQSLSYKQWFENKRFWVVDNVDHLFVRPSSLFWDFVRRCVCTAHMDLKKFVCLDDLPVKGTRQTPSRGYKHQAGNNQSLSYKHWFD